MSCTRFVAACALALGCVTSSLAQSADESKPSALWVNAGFYTHHFQSDKNLRNPNPGLGLEWAWDDTYSLTGGFFRNSDDTTSRYVGVYALPWHAAGARWGVVVGAFNGYPHAFDGGWFPALLPVASWETNSWGLNVTVIPTVGERLHGGVSFQLKYRLR